MPFQLWSRICAQRVQVCWLIKLLYQAHQSICTQDKPSQCQQEARSLLIISSARSPTNVLIQSLVARVSLLHRLKLWLLMMLVEFLHIWRAGNTYRFVHRRLIHGRSKHLREPIMMYKKPWPMRSLSPVQFFYKSLAGLFLLLMRIRWFAKITFQAGLIRFTKSTQLILWASQSIKLTQFVQPSSPLCGKWTKKYLMILDLFNLVLNPHQLTSVSSGLMLLTSL